jgi:hypothetical protein
MARCSKCGDDYEPDQMRCETCRWCADKTRFAEFARECGLDRFVDPRGERYVYNLDGSCSGKNVEEIDFMGELWNALAKAKSRPDVVVA